MSARAGPPEPESPFEHPAFEALYPRVLRDVADRHLDERTRKAAARALAFLLRERVLDERTTTDILTVLNRSLDVSSIVRALLVGLRSALGDHEKIAEWTRAVADRTLREGHVPSFIAAMRILVELPGYDGTVPARWRISLLRAIEVKELAPRVLCFCRDYVHRFPRESSWPWIQTARTRSTIAVLRQRVTVAEMREARLS